jgi:uncharacterized protein (DUF2235 family)
MPKNVVVCCDGTANEFAKNRTNVVKLFFTLAADPTTQVAYYHPGLGTMAPPGALTPLARRITRLAGLAFGYGLSADVRDAYVFIMNSFEAGDRLFLFGFSRGAYTVRAVTALLHAYGLIGRLNDAFVLYATRMMMAAEKLRDADSKDPRVDDYFDLARAFKATFSSRRCQPHFVGLWDTVSSVAWVANPLRLPFATNNPSIEIGRHAVAIDERRAFFRTNLWRPGEDPDRSGPKDLKQVWFPGVHCDVGGGYPEAESGLAKIALKWMLDEAAAAGLLLDPNKVDLVLGGRGQGYVPPDANGPMHESLKGAWNVAEFVPKRHWDAQTKRWGWRINNYRRRRLPPGACVHDAAFERGGGYAARLPPDVVRLSSLS